MTMYIQDPTLPLPQPWVARKLTAAGTHLIFSFDPGLHPGTLLLEGIDVAAVAAAPSAWSVAAGEQFSSLFFTNNQTGSTGLLYVGWRGSLGLNDVGGQPLVIDVQTVVTAQIGITAWGTYIPLQTLNIAA